MKILKLLIYFSLLLNLTCKDKDDTNQKIKFTRELPPDSAKKGSLFASILFLRDSLKLDTIENGYDSEQIRIWIRYSFTYKQQLIVLKNIDGHWEAFYYEFMPVYYNQTDSLQYIQKSVSKRDPKDSWENFVQKINSYDVLNLSDYTIIPGYYIPSHDGNMVAIEVSNLHTYRLSSYPSPSLVNLPEAKKIVSMVTTVAQELNIRLYSNL